MKKCRVFVSYSPGVFGQFGSQMASGAVSPGPRPENRCEVYGRKKTFEGHLGRGGPGRSGSQTSVTCKTVCAGGPGRSGSQTSVTCKTVCAGERLANLSIALLLAGTPASGTPHRAGILASMGPKKEKAAVVQESRLSVRQQLQTGSASSAPVVAELVPEPAAASASSAPVVAELAPEPVLKRRRRKADGAAARTDQSEDVRTAAPTDKVVPEAGDEQASQPEVSAALEAEVKQASAVALGAPSREVNEASKAEVEQASDVELGAPSTAASAAQEPEGEQASDVELGAPRSAASAAHKAEGGRPPKSEVSAAPEAKVEQVCGVINVGARSSEVCAAPEANQASGFKLGAPSSAAPKTEVIAGLEAKVEQVCDINVGARSSEVCAAPEAKVEQASDVNVEAPISETGVDVTMEPQSARPAWRPAWSHRVKKTVGDVDDLVDPDEVDTPPWRDWHDEEGEKRSVALGEDPGGADLEPASERRLPPSTAEPGHRARELTRTASWASSLFDDLSDVGSEAPAVQDQAPSSREAAGKDRAFPQCRADSKLQPHLCPPGPV